MSEEKRREQPTKMPKLGPISLKARTTDNKPTMISTYSKSSSARSFVQLVPEQHLIRGAPECALRASQREVGQDEHPEQGKRDAAILSSGRL